MIREGKDNKLAKVPTGVPAAGGCAGAFQVERCKESERIWKKANMFRRFQKPNSVNSMFIVKFYFSYLFGLFLSPLTNANHKQFPPSNLQILDFQVDGHNECTCQNGSLHQKGIALDPWTMTRHDNTWWTYVSVIHKFTQVTNEQIIIWKALAILLEIPTCNASWWRRSQLAFLPAQLQVLAQSDKKLRHVPPWLASRSWHVVDVV